jgi:hypothetical protein
MSNAIYAPEFKEEAVRFRLADSRDRAVGHAEGVIKTVD